MQQIVVMKDRAIARSSGKLGDMVIIVFSFLNQKGLCS